MGRPWRTAAWLGALRAEAKGAPARRCGLRRLSCTRTPRCSTRAARSSALSALVARVATSAAAAARRRTSASATSRPSPSRFCRALVQLERSTFHSYGLDAHARVLLLRCFFDRTCTASRSSRRTRSSSCASTLPTSGCSNSSSSASSSPRSRCTRTRAWSGRSSTCPTTRARSS